MNNILYLDPSEKATGVFVYDHLNKKALKWFCYKLIYVIPPNFKYNYEERLSWTHHFVWSMKTLINTYNIKKVYFEAHTGSKSAKAAWILSRCETAIQSICTLLEIEAIPCLKTHINKKVFGRIYVTKKETVKLIEDSFGEIQSSRSLSNDLYQDEKEAIADAMLIWVAYKDEQNNK